MCVLARARENKNKKRSINTSEHSISMSPSQRVIIVKAHKLLRERIRFFPFVTRKKLLPPGFPAQLLMLCHIKVNPDRKVKMCFIFCSIYVDTFVLFIFIIINHLTQKVLSSSFKWKVRRWKTWKKKKKKQKKKERTAYNLVIFNCELCEGLFQDEHDSLFSLAINWRRRLKFSFEKCMQNNFYALKFIAHYNQVRWIEIHLPYSMSVCVYVPKRNIYILMLEFHFSRICSKKAKLPNRCVLN